MMLLGRSETLSDDNLLEYSNRLGYRLSQDDCDEIRQTAGEGETVASAVKDFLSAYETPGRFK
jgi:hypothetical protein